MSIRYLKAKVVQRSKGQSVIGAAAYRVGDILTNNLTGQTWDYSQKSDVLYTEILAPHISPQRVHEREYLWNEVEAIETRKDAQLAKKLLLALPYELGTQESIDLVRRFLREECVNHGMIADFAIHVPTPPNDPRNIHCHVLLTTREISKEGFGGKKREWNRKAMLARWWREWERMKEEALNPVQKSKITLRGEFDLRL